MENLKVAIDSGYVEENNTLNILQTDELIAKIKHNQDFKEQFAELLQKSKTPLDKRNVINDMKKKGVGKKRKK